MKIKLFIYNEISVKREYLVVVPQKNTHQRNTWGIHPPFSTKYDFRFIMFIYNVSHGRSFGGKLNIYKLNCRSVCSRLLVWTTSQTLVVGNTYKISVTNPMK